MIPVSILDMPLLFNEETLSPFAVLQTSSAAFLTEFEKERDIKVHLFCEVKSESPQKKARNTNTKASKSAVIVSLHAIIYGSSRVSESVGDFLQQSAIYLQDPPLSMISAPYHNPHRLQQIMEPQDPSKEISHNPRVLGVESLEKSADPFSRLEYFQSLPEAVEPSALATPLYW